MRTLFGLEGSSNASPAEDPSRSMDRKKVGSHGVSWKRRHLELRTESLNPALTDETRGSTRVFKPHSNDVSSP